MTNMVIIRKENDRIYGQMIVKKENKFYNWDKWDKKEIGFGFFDFLKKDVEQKNVLLEFCIIDRKFVSSVKEASVKEGQLWKVDILRTIKDKRGKDVKIVRPIELIHYHTRNCSPFEKSKFLLISLFYIEEIETSIEKRTEAANNDELYEAYFDRYILTAKCPYCFTELKEEFTCNLVVKKEPDARTALKYWTDYLGEGWNKFIEEFYETRKKERELYYQTEEKKQKIRNKIAELEKVGITLIPLSEKERENYDSVNRDWFDFSFFGGEPEDNPPPKYYISITDPEKRRKAKEKIEELENLRNTIEENYYKEIMELWKDFIRRNKEMYEKCKFLISNKVYPVVIEAINSYDPYFFEFTSLENMDPVEATMFCLRALEAYVNKQLWRWEKKTKLKN